MKQNKLPRPEVAIDHDSKRALLCSKKATETARYDIRRALRLNE